MKLQKEPLQACHVHDIYLVWFSNDTQEYMV